MKKIIIAFLMVLSTITVFSQSNPAQYAGSGTSSNPYQIKTVNDLQNLNQYIGSGFTNVYFKLMNNLNLSGVNFTPIGTSTTDFYGNFDGNYCEISNLAGNDKSLFYTLAQVGRIRNVIMTNAEISSNRPSAELAIIVLYNRGIVENCHAHGKITAGSQDQTAYGKGGIASSNISTGIIRNCFVDVEISGRQRIGGITGKNHGIVEKCYSRGKLTCTDQINGGIAGQSDNQVKNCVNIIPTIAGLPASGSMGTYRVYSYAGTGANNYSLNTTTINGATVTSGTSTNYNGLNATDAQLKTQSFWQSIGYDFQNTWKMSAANGKYKGYPILKGQDDGFRYEIHTVADLLKLSNEVRNGDEKSGCTYVLMNDLDLSGVNFPPIGTASSTFYGDFDGNYHTISNLSGHDKHFIRRIPNGSTIRNVLMKNANITTTQSAVDMAILVLYNNGTIENCYAEGKITAFSDESSYGKGGITSYNAGTVRNCFANVEIKGRQRIGAVVGKNHSVVENCYSRGN